MKKLIALTLAIFALLTLTACEHRHTIDTWSVDYYKHWHVCTECSEQTDISAHEFNKQEICIVCGAKVTINDNGTINVTVYDSEGNAIKELNFDENGHTIENGSVKY